MHFQLSFSQLSIHITTFLWGRTVLKITFVFPHWLSALLYEILQKNYLERAVIILFYIRVFHLLKSLWKDTQSASLKLIKYFHLNVANCILLGNLSTYFHFKVFTYFLYKLLIFIFWVFDCPLYEVCWSWKVFFFSNVH